MNRSPKQIYSISKLNEQIKRLLEENFSMVWVSGEISNLRIPTSGHAYFTLKDDRAQIAAVMFRGQLRQLRFDLEDGITIVGLCRVSVYEPRGTYQVILEYVEPKSAGALQLAFEQLKRKLSREGLFDEARKRPIPLLPETICIITSSSGAAVHDMLHVLNRRWRGVAIEILPVSVQGNGAENDIVRAIACANRRARAEVLILARGGGSLEDLAAFNSEAVARAIFQSGIPVISAVGHETDYTIADFVSDLRAPTPSAAAEMAVPVKVDLQARCEELRQRCLAQAERVIVRYREALVRLRRALVHVHPRNKLQDLQQHMDELNRRLQRAVRHFIHLRKAASEDLLHKVYIYNPIYYLNKTKAEVELKHYKLLQCINKIVLDRKSALAARQAGLTALSPRAVLERGYSITRRPNDGKVVKSADSVSAGDTLEVLLHQGMLRVSVDSSHQR